MKLCPNCGMRVEIADVCPYCKTELSPKDEKAFQKDYTTDLLRIVWFSVMSFVLASVSLIVWGEVLGGISVHTLSFAAISLVMSFVQFHYFGKYSRRFHTSTFWKITIVTLKYACGVVALMIAVAPIVILLT